MQQENSADFQALATQLGEALRAVQATLVTAESCTGGWAGEVITSVPGSSHWYERGFITYTNIAKREMLDVGADILSRHGAVSEATARAMAEGALAYSRADFALAITGIAGPGGGSPEKPLGTVCFAWAGKNCASISQTRHFNGERQDIRAQAVASALQGMIDMIQQCGSQRVSRPGQVVK